MIFAIQVVNRSMNKVVDKLIIIIHSNYYKYKIIKFKIIIPSRLINQQTNIIDEISDFFVFMYLLSK